MPPAAAGVTPEAIARLEELGALRDRGVLTEEEFTTQEDTILGP